MNCAWVCRRCKEVVPNEEVTYEEFHDGCGGFVEWEDIGEQKDLLARFFVEEECKIIHTKGMIPNIPCPSCNGTGKTERDATIEDIVHFAEWVLTKADVDFIQLKDIYRAGNQFVAERKIDEFKETVSHYRTKSGGRLKLRKEK
jgi:hypothetical protein